MPDTTPASSKAQARTRGLTLGPLSFATKKAAVERIRAVLRGNREGVPLDGDDLAIAMALFDMHPQYAEKAEGGVVGFCVKVNRDHGYAPTRGLHVIHDDGTTIDFSFYVSLDHSRVLPTIQTAARHALLGSQRAFKEQAFSGGVALCDACSAPLAWSTAQIHHEPPLRFRDILRLWQEQNKEPEIVSRPRFGDDFADAAERTRFVEFHDAIAKRTLVCAACNYAAERAA